MPDTKVEGVELKKLIKKGKRRPLSFAFCPGPKGDHIILIDKRKKPDVLSRIARRDGPGNRVAYGTFVVKAKILELTCVKEIPNMAMSLRKHLKSNKIFLNILIINLQGEVLERDDEELPDDPDWDRDDDDDDDDDAPQEDDAVQTADTVPDTVPDSAVAKAALAGRIKAVQPAISTVPGSNGEVLKKAFAKAVSQIKSGDLKAAEHTISMLEAAAAKLAASASGGQTPPAKATPPAGAAPDARTLARSLALRANALKQQIQGIPDPAAKQLTKALQGAVKQIRAGELAGADTLLTRIEGAAERVAEQQSSASDTAGPYAKPRQIWAQARNDMRRELEGLKTAIDQATAGFEGLQEVPAKSAVLFDYLDGIDSGLEDALAQLGKNPDETRRESLKSAARKSIQQYRGVLDSEFFQAVDGNGFVNTRIRADALKSLQQVSAALET